MGLDTSHNCWHGPYSSFHGFRKQLGKLIGIDLEKMEGFGGEISFDTIEHDLVPLLSHSDCDGELTVEESKQIVNGLNQVIPLIEESIKQNPDEQYHLKKAIQFRDGLLDAINKNEVVDFH